MRAIRVWILAVAAALAAGGAGRAEAAQALAPGVWLIPGGIRPDREPDGNTVVFAAPRGLVVFDTGRHAWHSQAILDFAKARRAPVAAVVNSHWHLDHTSGNLALKRAWPGLKVYATDAIDEALGGFLKRSAEQGREAVARGGVPATLAEDIAQDAAVSADGARLKPDVVVRSSGRRPIAGRALDVRLANGATRGDVWLFDPKTKVAAVGDLVTVPAPFLDTACPSGWRAALDAIWATPFSVVVPGHGRPLSRAEFGAYRSAFSALVDCAASGQDKQACAKAWALAIDPLIAPDDATADRKRAVAWTVGYVEMLRGPGLAANCVA